MPFDSHVFTFTSLRHVPTAHVCLLIFSLVVERYRWCLPVWFVVVFALYILSSDGRKNWPVDRAICSNSKRHLLRIFSRSQQFDWCCVWTDKFQFSSNSRTYFIWYFLFARPKWCPHCVLTVAHESNKLKKAQAPRQYVKQLQRCVHCLGAGELVHTFIYYPRSIHYAFAVSMRDVSVGILPNDLNLKCTQCTTAPTTYRISHSLNRTRTAKSVHKTCEIFADNNYKSKLLWERCQARADGEYSGKHVFKYIETSMK